VSRVGERQALGREHDHDTATEWQPSLNTEGRRVEEAEALNDARGEMQMLFGVIYTPREYDGPAGSGLQLFSNWKPPLAFVRHWSFAAGGGMGLTEARTSSELSRAIAPFVPFFDFRVERVEEIPIGAGTGPALAVA
jgi:hypothetical protein